MFGSGGKRDPHRIYRSLLHGWCVCDSNTIFMLETWFKHSIALYFHDTNFFIWCKTKKCKILHTNVLVNHKFHLLFWFKAIHGLTHLIHTKSFKIVIICRISIFGWNIHKIKVLSSHEYYLFYKYYYVMHFKCSSVRLTPLSTLARPFVKT